MSGKPKAEVLSTHTPELFAIAVQRAAESLRAGEIVALPTETVYGLAANALDAIAVKRIFEAKGRPANNPIIVHVADMAVARRCVREWSDRADQLAKAFWPGPLTLVMPRSKEIPDIVTAGGPTVGIRWPSHPLIQAVIRECDFPLAAPSANPSGSVSPTNAAHVLHDLGDKISLIVDGGQSQVGIESAVVDLSVHPARILRPGMIHRESLAAVLGDEGLSTDPANPNPATGEPWRSPGMLPKHYAPKAKLLVLRWRDEADLNAQLAILRALPGKTHVIAHTRIPLRTEFAQVAVVPHDAEAYARAVYAELRRCDDAGAGLIVIEEVPETGAWKAIADRLRRAGT